MCTQQQYHTLIRKNTTNHTKIHTLRCVYFVSILFLFSLLWVFHELRKKTSLYFPAHPRGCIKSLFSWRSRVFFSAHNRTLNPSVYQKKFKNPKYGNTFFPLDRKGMKTVIRKYISDKYSAEKSRIFTSEWSEVNV